MGKLLDRSSALKRRPSRAQIRGALSAAYHELIEFATTTAFQSLLTEMYELPATERPHFVNQVVLNQTAMQKRGIVPPSGIYIQRSSFGDRRPTLFCIKKFIPEEFQSHWQNANITFDNLTNVDDVPRDARAWRPPLPFDVQQGLVTGALNEDDLD
jgi:hypothetical protein